MEPTRRDVMIGAAAAVLSTQPVLGAVERPRPPVDPVDLNHWLRQVSTARQRIETADRRAVRSVLMAGDESGAERSLEVAAFVNEASWVANVLTAFAMLPPEQRNDPLVQGYLADNGRRLAQGVVAQVDFLKSLTPAERQDAVTRLRGDPAWLNSVRACLHERIDAIHDDESRRRQWRNAMDVVMRRATLRDLSKVIDVEIARGERLIRDLDLRRLAASDEEADPKRVAAIAGSILCFAGGAFGIFCTALGVGFGGWEDGIMCAIPTLAAFALAILLVMVARKRKEASEHPAPA